MVHLLFQELDLLVLGPRLRGTSFFGLTAEAAAAVSTSLVFSGEEQPQFV